MDDRDGSALFFFLVYFFEKILHITKEKLARVIQVGARTLFCSRRIQFPNQRDLLVLEQMFRL